MAARLQTRFASGVDAAWSDFDELALEVFSVQYEGNAVYRALCDARGATPARVSHWREAPLVPATAFRHLDLAVGSPSDASLVFHTSGTTGGSRPGRHFVPRASLYRASLLSGARAYLLPEGHRMGLLSLIPPPAEAPHSSLSYMVGSVAGELCSDVRWTADGRGNPDIGRFLDAVHTLEGRRDPVLVVGTAFGFVGLLEAMARTGRRMALAEGTRVMETGGFKGRVRAVPRAELYGTIQEWLGVPEGRIINEYGMTELLSQLYEPVLREGPGARRHVPPPWLAVRALDPSTLEERPAGHAGLLAFYDLANLGSVSAVLTQDVGTVVDGAVTLEGRAPGSEPRGCSLALEEILAASEFRP